MTMRALTIGIILAAVGALVIRELRQNSELPRALTREVRRLVTGNLPPAAVLPACIVTVFLALLLFFAVVGPP